tara:strand:+ start:486 stop:773 length:288 start_codon:yes stop_codon:yes gene_type:complete
MNKEVMIQNEQYFYNKGYYYKYEVRGGIKAYYAINPSFELKISIDLNNCMLGVRGIQYKTVIELKELAKLWGTRTTGKKAEIVEGLIAYYHQGKI